MKIGMIFPGQGSQFVGMAKEFYDNERLVQEYFELASNCLNQNFVRMCFASSERELMQTINTQTSIFLVSTCIFLLLKEKYKIKADILLGHTMGEYSAIFAGGGISFPDGLYLLKKRSQFMDEALVGKQTGMLTILNCPEEKLKHIIARYNEEGNDDAVAEIVQFNTPRNFVVAGTLSLLGNIALDVSNTQGRAILQKVSGAFRSRLMKPAEKRFIAYLEKVDLHNLHTPIISTVHGYPISTALDLRRELIEHMSNPILWWQSIQYLRDCDLIIEIGPGSKLNAMIHREWKQKVIISINQLHDIDHLLATIKTLENKSI